MASSTAGRQRAIKPHPIAIEENDVDSSDSLERRARARLGIDPLAAHLFLFYFGMLSLITPPDFLSTYTAAAIAKADFWKTGWVGMRLGVVAYVVPFIFAFRPARIGHGGRLPQ